MSVPPPITLTLWFCQECGKDDRWQPFFPAKSQKSHDDKCSGTLERLTYIRSEIAI